MSHYDVLSWKFEDKFAILFCDTFDIRHDHKMEICLLLC